jgi:hypothetical protein
VRTNEGERMETWRDLCFDVTDLYSRQSGLRQEHHGQRFLVFRRPYQLPKRESRSAQCPFGQLGRYQVEEYENQTYSNFHIW